MKTTINKFNQSMFIIFTFSFLSFNAYAWKEVADLELNLLQVRELTGDKLFKKVRDSWTYGRNFIEKAVNYCDNPYHESSYACQKFIHNCDFLLSENEKKIRKKEKQQLLEDSSYFVKVITSPKSESDFYASLMYHDVVGFEVSSYRVARGRRIVTVVVVSDDELLNSI